jgi:hypothetical protein
VSGARLPDLRSKAEFISAIASAVRNRTGFAAGKIGGSERFCIYWPILRGRTRDPRRLRAYEVALGHHGEVQTGIFPRDPGFYERYYEFFVEQARQHDFLGLFGDPNEPAIFRHYQLGNRLMDYQDQEPDRSCPDDPASCYLPEFAGKRLLLVSPFAPLLRSRANQATFESVWANTGKRWFHPSAVESLSVPYGWSSEVQQRHGDSIRLLRSLTDDMDALSYDAALIGAGGMGIPLAAHAKARGKVAIALGGHLQVLFGVLGERWRNSQSWRTKYINRAWIDLPEEYVPREEVLVDQGAYW